jgi:hypothetical protein
MRIAATLKREMGRDIVEEWLYSRFWRYLRRWRKKRVYECSRASWIACSAVSGKPVGV